MGFFFGPSAKNAHLNRDLISISPLGKTAGKLGVFFGGEIVGAFGAVLRFFAHSQKTNSAS